MKHFLGLMALVILISTSCVLYLLYLKADDVDLNIFDTLHSEDVDSYRGVFNSVGYDVDKKNGRRILDFLRSAAESGRRYNVTSKNIISFGKLEVWDDNKVVVMIDLFHGGDGLVFYWKTNDRSICITSNVSGRAISDLLQEGPLSDDRAKN